MRLAILLLLSASFLSLSIHAKPQERLKFDWSLVPVGGDKDFKEKRSKLKDVYLGKEVVVEDAYIVINSTSDRDIMVSLRHPAKRGELNLYQEIGAKFHDVDQRPFNTLAAQKTRVKVSGKVVVGKNAISLEDAKLLKPKKK